MASGYQSLATEYLTRNGPTLSSELASYLVRKSGCSIEAARMAVSRLKLPIKRLKGISFKDTQKFIYLNSQFGSENFRIKLIEALINHNTAAGRALLAINARGGRIRSSDFSSIAGAPIENYPKQLKSDVVKAQLTDNNILTPEDFEGKSYYRAFNSPKDPFECWIELQLADLLVQKCAEWTLRVGFSSENTSAIRSPYNKTPQFGFFAWDITSPTYLHGLSQWKNSEKKPGFFAADILFKQEAIQLKDLSAFIHKIEVINSQRTDRRFIPALIHLGMEEEALKKLRGMGVMCLEPKSFGDPQIASIMKELLSFLKDTRKFFGDTARLNELINKMINSDIGRLLNLPGPLFQIIVAFLYKSEGHMIETGRQITSKEGPAEIDVLVVTTGKDLICIETKGYKRNKLLDINEIVEWIETKRPRIVKWYENTMRSAGYKTMRFEFIISSEYTEAQLEDLQEVADYNYKNYPIRFLDKKHVEGLAKKHSQNEILKGLKEHF